MIEQKQEVLQKEYQNELELIIEEVTVLKFEKLAEVKIMYKHIDTSDQEKVQERDQAIQEIKDECELVK